MNVQSGDTCTLIERLSGMRKLASPQIWWKCDAVTLPAAAAYKMPPPPPAKMSMLRTSKLDL